MQMSQLPLIQVDFYFLCTHSSVARGSASPFWCHRHSASTIFHLVIIMKCCFSFPSSASLHLQHIGSCVPFPFSPYREALTPQLSFSLFCRRHRFFFYLFGILRYLKKKSKKRKSLSFPRTPQLTCTHAHAKRRTYSGLR